MMISANNIVEYACKNDVLGNKMNNIFLEGELKIGYSVVFSPALFFLSRGVSKTFLSLNFVKICLLLCILL